MSVRASARSLAAPAGRAAMRGVVGVRTRGWASHTRLFVVGDGVGWSLDEDARVLEERAARLGVTTAPSSWARFTDHQAVFHTSHFTAVHPRWLETTHRVATSWFHGRPGTPGYPEFDEAFDALRRHPDVFARVQVTHREMEELVLEHGIPPGRVFRIPIGVDLARFPFGGAPQRRSARAALGLPESAFVIGSFQKDGVGWGDGLDPKLVKGPDVLVAVLAELRQRMPELWVLLTGPARGYVVRELLQLGVPHVHVRADRAGELARAYHALDLYLVCSRQEGGPKAALEAMATGVPLVCTRVGQAQELVVDGVNGLLADVDDVGALASAAARVYDDTQLSQRLTAEGRAVATAHALARLDDRWGQFFDGFVARRGVER